MTYPFTLVPLEFAYDALEPNIDAWTMELHHSKHLQAFVDNLNNTLKDYPEFHSWTIEELLCKLTELPEKIQTPVRNFAGGIFNHNFYFKMLTPKQEALKDGTLKTAIEAVWGGVDTFLTDFKAAGMSVFGSGWAYLVADKNGKLSIYRTPNQDTPIPANLITILILDVWEHAYYLKNQNRRAEYIDYFFNVIDWQKAQRNFEF